MSIGDWRDRAACQNVSPDLFFPVTDSGPLVQRQVEQAKAVCRRCPVRSECLAFALDHLSSGIAGGLTADERRTQSRTVTKEEGRRSPAGIDGRRALRSGGSVADVADEFRVTRRTAERWATQARTGPGWAS